MSRKAVTFTCLSLVLVFGAALQGQEKKPPKVTFDDDVLPVFRQKCASCHNPDKKSGDLDLTTYPGVMEGGGSGNVVEAGDSSSSYLYHLITHESEPFMPPESPKIPDTMIETVRKWIDGGLLENKGSKAIAAKKKKFDLALQAPSTERPATPPMPPRLSLQPVTQSAQGTAIASIATNPWSSLAAVSGQKQVLLYNTKTLELVGALPFPEGFPEILRFSRNGSLLLAGGGRGGASGKVIVWDVRTGERIMEVGNELDSVLAADISSDHGLIALGGPQRVVRIYSTETGQLLHELRKHTDWIYSLEFSPDSVLLATGDRNGGLHVWEAYTGREYLTLKAHSKGVSAVSWRSDSNVVASASEDGSIRLWEMENGGQVRNWGGHGGGVASLEFCRDGRLVSAGRDRLVKLWDQAGKQLRAFEAFGDLALESSFCDESARVIGGDWSGEIRVWNAADGARVGVLPASPPTLEKRLADAQAAVTQAKAAHAPLAQAYTVAKAASDKVVTDLTAVQNAEKAATAEKAKADAEVKTKTATMAQATQAKNAAKAVVDKLTPTVPMLSDAAAKAEQAAKALASDKEVADLAAKLKAAFARHSANLKSQQVILDTKTKEIATIQTAIKQQQTLSAAAAAKMADMKKKVADLTPKVKPMADAAAKAKGAADAAATTVATAEKSVAKWQQEIAFAKQLEALLAARTKAEEALNAELETAGETKAETDKQAAVVAAAKAKMAELQKVTAAEQVKVDSLTKAGTTYQAAQATSSKERDAAKANASKLTPVLQSLQAAVASAKKAVDQSGNDKSVVDAHAALAKVVAAKQTALNAANQLAAAKQKEYDQATASLAKSQADLKVAAQALTTAKANVVAQAKVVAAEDQKMATAAKASEAAMAKVAAAEKAVAKANTDIAAAKGIAAPAG